MWCFQIQERQSYWFYFKLTFIVDVLGMYSDGRPVGIASE